MTPSPETGAEPTAPVAEISTLLGGEGLGDAFSWQTLIWSVIGGVIVAFIWQAITSRRGTRV